MRALFGLTALAFFLPLMLADNGKASPVAADNARAAKDFPWAAFAVSPLLQAQVTDSADRQLRDPEIKKLIRELGDPDYKVRENATKRLTAIGFPALDALRDASGKGDAEIRARAADIVKSIHAANPLTTRVKGMEFKLVIDKEWLLPKVGRTTHINVALEFKNTTDTVYRILLFGPINGAFGKSKAVRPLEDTRVIGASSTQPQVSPPLAKNETYTMPFGGVLSKPDAVRAAFSMSAFGRSFVAKTFITKGDYHFGFIYENTQQAYDGGAPYWEGKAETPLAAVTVSEKVEK